MSPTTNRKCALDHPQGPSSIKHRKWIFDVKIEKGAMISEDIYVCRRLTNEGGFKIYLDPKITCNHVGGKKYKGNFLNWYNSTKPKLPQRQQSGIDYLNQFKNLY